MGRARRGIGLAGAAALALAAVALLPPSSSATRLQHLDTRALTRGSHQIVIGRVESVRPRWNDTRTKIFTDVAVRVSESIKGDAEDRITLTQLGGEIDSLKVSVPGGPLFVAGEEALLFIWRDDRGGAQVTGLGQGKFDITIDRATGRRVTQRRIPGLEIGEVRLLKSVPRNAPARGVALDDLVAEIRRAMVEGDR